jgi:hypothetical protein
MPKNTDVADFHVQYLDVTSQYWHPKSEHFAGGDNLITAIDRGWAVQKCVLVQHWYAGMRSVKVYEFTLQRGENTMLMPVISNPYVERFIKEEPVQLAEKEDSIS